MFLFLFQVTFRYSPSFTPFELMFGRAPVLPIEMKIRSKPSSTDSLSDKVGDVPSDFNKKVRVMMNIRDQVKAQAMQNTDKAQQRQKKSYDVEHQPLRFKASKGGKLEGAWSGPFSINRVLAKGLYKLRNEDGTMLKTSFNSSRLMIYYHPVQ